MIHRCRIFSSGIDAVAAVVVLLLAVSIVSASPSPCRVRNVRDSLVASPRPIPSYKQQQQQQQQEDFSYTTIQEALDRCPPQDNGYVHIALDPGFYHARGLIFSRYNLTYHVYASNPEDRPVLSDACDWDITYSEAAYERPAVTDTIQGQQVAIQQRYDVRRKSESTTTAAPWWTEHIDPRISVPSLHLESLVLDGSDSDSHLFMLADNSIAVEHCHVRNYAGTHVLHTRATFDFVTYRIWNTTFSSLWGSAIEAHGLAAYDLRGNTFEACGGDLSDHCVRLGMMYGARGAALFSDNLFRSAMSIPSERSFYAYDFDTIPESCSEVSLESNDIIKGDVRFQGVAMDTSVPDAWRGTPLMLHGEYTVLQLMYETFGSLRDGEMWWDGNEIHCSSLEDCRSHALEDIDAHFCLVLSTYEVHRGLSERASSIYSGIQEALDHCSESIVVIHGTFYVEELRVSGRRILLSYTGGTIVGQNHRMSGDSIYVRGISFVHSFQDRVPLIQLSSSAAVVTNCNFEGHLSLTTPAVMTTASIGSLRFHYNSLVSMSIDSGLQLLGDIDILHVTNNQFLNAGGSVLWAKRVKTTCMVEHNYFWDCRSSSLSYHDTKAIIYLGGDGHCSLALSDNVIRRSDDSHVLGVASQDTCFTIEQFSSLNVTNNVCTKARYGIVFIDSDVFDIESMYLNNVMIQNTVYQGADVHSSHNFIFLSGERDMEVLDWVAVESCHVNQDYRHEEGYRFSNISSAIRFCPPGVEIQVHCNRSSNCFFADEGEQYIDTDTYIRAVGDLTPVFTSTSYVIYNGVGLTMQGVDLHYDPIRNSYYERVSGHNDVASERTDAPALIGSKRLDRIKWLRLYNVRMVGNWNRTLHSSIRYHDAVGVRIDETSAPEDASFEMVDCTVIGWHSLPDTAYRIAAQHRIYDTEEREAWVGEDMLHSGGRVLVRYGSTSINPSWDTSGFSDTTLTVAHTFAVVKNNVFQRVDGTALWIDRVDGWNITGNFFLDCGGRAPHYESVVRLKANPSLENGVASYTFDDNHAWQRLPILFPTAGGLITPTAMSAFWIYGFSDLVDIEHWTLRGTSVQGEYPIGIRLSMVTEKTLSQTLPADWIRVSYKDTHSDILADLAQQGNCNVNGVSHDIVWGGANDALSSYKSCDESVAGGDSCKCPTAHPPHCLVDHTNQNYTEGNPYYRTWLFRSMAEAFEHCASPSRIIELEAETSERMVVSTSDWYVFGGTITNSGHAFANVKNVTFADVTFVHAGEESTFYSRHASQDIRFLRVTFDGGHTRQSAISGAYDSISVEECTFDHYQSSSLPAVDVTSARATIKHNAWHYVHVNALCIREAYEVDINNNMVVRDQFEINSSGTALPYASMYVECSSACHSLKFHHNRYYQAYTHFHTIQDDRIGDSDKVALTSDDQGTVEPAYTAFWIQGMSLGKYYSVRNNEVRDVQLGMRFTGIPELEHSALSMRHQFLSDVAVLGRNMAVEGQWHDIVYGPLENDPYVDRVAFENNANICDGGCDTDDFIAIGAIIVIVAVVAILVCCIIGFGMQKPGKVDWMYSNVLHARIPIDSDLWPVIRYGVVPGYGARPNRPLPAVLGNNEANRYALAREEAKHRYTDEEIAASQRQAFGENGLQRMFDGFKATSVYSEKTDAARALGYGRSDRAFSLQSAGAVNDSVKIIGERNSSEC